MEFEFLRKSMVKSIGGRNENFREAREILIGSDSTHRVDMKMELQAKPASLWVDLTPPGLAYKPLGSSSHVI